MNQTPKWLKTMKIKKTIKLKRTKKVVKLNKIDYAVYKIWNLIAKTGCMRLNLYKHDLKVSIDLAISRNLILF